MSFDDKDFDDAALWALMDSAASAASLLSKPRKSCQTLIPVSHPSPKHSRSLPNPRGLTLSQAALAHCPPIRTVPCTRTGERSCSGSLSLQISATGRLPLLRFHQ
ncbi:hypothetical protein MLD38_016072 [Melastoma candidum]|uniref:Uncharacterized protein n=1 Tax=Melastoma candidum TaxID=119954 RepID=A0ACB9RHH2_9MYRT|nr:hypothetical protein MLD38_016072 [Melastoma candidum]